MLIRAALEDDIQEVSQNDNPPSEVYYEAVVNEETGEVSAGAEITTSRCDRTQYTYYLGTALTKPRIEILRSWEEIFADNQGQGHPADLAYQGMGALITVALSRWNETVYQRMAREGIAGSRPGTEEYDSIGKLLVRQCLRQQLYLIFPKADSEFYEQGTGLTGNGGLFPKGYLFRAVTLVNPDALEPGTDVLCRILQFRAIRVRNRDSGRMFLFDILPTTSPFYDAIANNVDDIGQF